MSKTCCTRLADNTGRKISPKIRHLRTIAQFSRAISSQLRQYRQSTKSFLNSNMSPTCPYNMVNFGSLPAEIISLVWGTPAISTGFASWQRYCTAFPSGRQPNFAALNSGHHLCSAGRLSRWALAHILVLSFFLMAAL